MVKVTVVYSPLGGLRLSRGECVPTSETVSRCCRNLPGRCQSGSISSLQHLAPDKQSPSSSTEKKSRYFAYCSLFWGNRSRAFLASSGAPSTAAEQNQTSRAPANLLSSNHRVQSPWFHSCICQRHRSLKCCTSRQHLCCTCHQCSLITGR